jgi:hypothetical protein
MHAERLSEIWQQDATPVILRRDGHREKLRARVPGGETERGWINSLGKSYGNWIIAKHSYWELPKKWFNNFVNGALDRYGQLYVIQPFREQEKCAPACMNASGHICECSCMGEHHGAGNDGSWFEVSDAFATRWHGRELACRFMSAKRKLQ